ncbi:APC family permease [Adhaeribacter soli]|uniref:Tetratricopeptide repeat protein n=1 Tax=Adhaeribacter soli TaxID=2607655 RepID=A0A5N1J2P0_9BACT|nr:APC family permease [Adhaeribacter soli]KAA9340776.1 hypothetical protein F0P94_04940 [Adhaeribacter soli]
MFLPPKSAQRITNNEPRTTTFWQNQPASLKYPYLFLLFISLAAVGLGLYHYFTGDDAMIRWVTVPHLQPVDAYIDQFKVAGQEFNIKANGYLLTERFDTSLPFINVQAAYFYLTLLSLALVFFLAAASTLKRWAFLGAMVLLMFFLVTVNLEGLGLISQAKSFILLPVMLGLALPAYAFHAFYPHVSFPKRLLTFAVLVGIIGFFVFSQSQYPATATVMHLVNHGTQAALVASVLFIFWVAYENIHFLVWINTQAKNPASRFGVWHFLLVALLYLANLTLIYLEEAGIYDLDLVYLDPFIILFLSSLAGFWGLRKREEIYGFLVNFWPGAAFLFLVFAILTFLNIGYAFATANDPMIEGYNSIIVYVHLAIGFLFFLYVMVNFGRLIGQKLQVYKVIYDPKKLPIFTVYIMGTIATVGLFVKTNAYTYSQVKAGYYNYLGDLYKVTGEEILADKFYQEGSIFDHHNIKSNYSLAGISREKNFRSTEIVYLKEALRRGPNEKIYARLSAMFNEKEYFFEQQFTLKAAIREFPRSAKLYNNMALLYNKTALLDSVLYYYSLAENFDEKEPVIQSNKLAFLIKNGLPEEAKKVAEANTSSEHIPLQSNAILLQHLTGQPTPAPEWPQPETEFNPGTFAKLYHTVLNRLHTSDTTAISHLNGYITKPENANYAEDFSLLKGALQQYHTQPLKAKETLENLSRTSAHGTGYYQDILGLWMLKYGLNQTAADYFAKARNNGFPEAPLHEAWALAFAGKKAEALEAVRSQLTSDNPDQAREATLLLVLLETSPEQALSFKNEAHKVQYMQVQPLSATIDFLPLLSSIQNPEIKMAGKNALVSRYLQQNNLLQAQQFLANLNANPENKTPEQAERNRLLAMVWSKTGNLTALNQNLDKMYLEPEFEGEKVYYRALLAEKEKQTAKAKTLYNQAEKLAPFNPDAILAASRFYRDQVKDDMQAYTIIMTGITYNPFSAPLYKAYVLQSLKTGFESYAASGMEHLQTLIPAEEYATFNQVYQAELAKIQAATQGWE